MYHERFVQGEEVIDWLVASPDEFVLSLKRNGTLLVEYTAGFRSLRGRRTPYEFKSIEKLRYDFEQDIAHSR